MKNPEDYTHACYETRHETTDISQAALTPYTTFADKTDRRLEARDSSWVKETLQFTYTYD